MGKDMIQGLIDGVKSMGTSLMNSIGDIVNGAIQSAKNMLGIHSPSLVFYGFGENTIQGFNNGVEAQIPTLEAKMLKMSQIAMNPIKGMNNISDSRYSGNDYSDNRVYKTINNQTQPQNAGFGWLETA
jgi:hypothetical protein